MSGRAITTIVVRRISHVAAVIGRVQRFIVPAHRKENLHSETILAEVSIRLKSICFGCRWHSKIGQTRVRRRDDHGAHVGRLTYQTKEMA